MFQQLMLKKKWFKEEMLAGNLHLHSVLLIVTLCGVDYGHLLGREIQFAHMQRNLFHLLIHSFTHLFHSRALALELNSAIRYWFRNTQIILEISKPSFFFFYGKQHSSMFSNTVWF